jgi:hypothetical protein
MIDQLQNIFSSEDGEHAYSAAIGAMIHAGQFSDANVKLMADIQNTGSTLAALCAAASEDSVIVSGWDDVIEAVEQFEGDAITAIGIILWNEVETAVGKQEAYEPGLDLALYSDASFPFSSASQDQIRAENTSAYTIWQGQGEDIEAYIEIEGLAALNQALLNHKHRIHLRAEDGETPTLAHPEYIAFVLASWVRVLRFYQAVRVQLDRKGLPGAIPVIMGCHNIKPFLGAALYPTRIIAAKPTNLAELTIKRTVTEVVPNEVPSGSTVRQRVVEVAANDSEAPPVRKGFLARLFGRG